MKCLMFLCACIVSLVVCSACVASEKYTPRPYTQAEMKSLNDAKMPWRKGVEDEGKKIEKSESESAEVERQILEELRSMRGEQSQRPSQTAPVMEKPSVRERAKEKAEEVKDAVLESPFLKHAAALAALVALCMVGHAVYVKCHADKAKIQAGLAALPVGGVALSAAFGKVDDLNTAIDAKVQAAKASIDAKLQSVQAAPAVAPAASAAK